MICNNNCRKCNHFIRNTIECGYGKKLMVIEFDFETYMNNLPNIEFEKYNNEDGYHFDDYDDISSLYILRKKSPFYIDIGKINNELKKFNLKIQVLEYNTDCIGDYLLVEKVKL